jgi:subtilisin family serine protease
MVVVASAGNSGQSSWRHIVSPSDAFGALSIGAVNTNGERAPFSSVGPSADGRIKPDIMAHGWGVPVVPPSGNIGTTSGTSLSSPVISGLVAALWQKFPAATAPQIIDAVIKSSSRFNNPDEFYGYGIPDFLKASLILQNAVEPPEFIELNVFPNPFRSHSTIVFYSNQPYSAIIEIFNLAGKRVYRDSNIEIVNGTNFVSLANLHHFENGTYLLRLVSKDGVFLSAKKIIKLSK